MKARMRPRGSEDAQHAKRQVGIDLLLSKKHSQFEIAAMLKVAHGTVRGWSSQMKRGVLVMNRKGVRGRAVGVGRSLTKVQERRIIAMIRDKTPDQMHLEFYLWSVGAVMSLIKKRFQKELSESGVRKYLAAWGFTIQRPATRYSSRDDVLVQHWLKEVYPAIAAKAKSIGAEMHWLDEAGVNNQAIYQRGFSPRGRTPVTIKPARREKISMVSTVTNMGTMRFKLYEGGLKGPLLIDFLEQLLKESARKIFIIMDNLPVHKSKTVRAWLEKNADKIEAFYLPPYAPDLNPDEYLNNDLKQNVHRLSGLAHTKRALKSNVISYLRHIQKSPAKVQSYFQTKETKYAA